MSIDIQKLKRMLAVQVEEQLDKQAFDKMATEKLQSILSAAKLDCDAETYAEVTEAINAFIASGSVQKSKLYHYCLDFVDPTRQKPVAMAQQSYDTHMRRANVSQNMGLMIDRHRFFDDNELAKLRDFVKTHANDKTFGDVVYEMMNKRGLTAPQLYRRAMLSRQDFSRITDPHCKNVTRSMVWSVIMGLHCTPEEAEYVLFSAGYRKRNDKFDLTLMFFLEHKNYNINDVNGVLADFGLKPLSCYAPVVD